MRIVRSPMTTGFTKVPNSALRDKRLSWRARAIHAFLLSHLDEGWPSDAKFLAEAGPDGRDACQKGLNELAKYGYIERSKRRLANGHWVTDVVVFEIPATPPPGDVKPQVAPEPDYQESVNQESVNQGSVNQESETQESIQKTKEKTTKKTNENTPVSQSAQAREAARWLRNRYGLTDEESAVVVEEVRRRAPAPINNLVRYLDGMAEGDLADIVKAVMDTSEPEPHLRVVEDYWCGKCDEGTHLAGDPDHPYRCPDCHPLRKQEAS